MSNDKEAWQKAVFEGLTTDSLEQWAKKQAEERQLRAADVTKTQIEVIARHYLIAALWSEEPDDESWDDCEPSEEAIQEARKEALKFIVLAGGVPDYGMGYEAEDCPPGFVNESMTGHDLWLTRNGHGTGFWDRPELGRKETARLSEIAQEMGGVYIYLGDDNKIHTNIST